MTDEFYGTVVLREWIDAGGRQSHNVYGLCKVMGARDVLAHEVNDRDSNWLIRVSPAAVPGGRDRVHLLGCTIRAVVRHERPLTQDEIKLIPDVWAVS